MVGAALVLLWGMLGLFFVCGAIALTIYGFRTRRPRRGFIASLVALALSVLSVWLSLPFWDTVLSGSYPNGDAFHYDDMWPMVAFVVVEALAILASIISAARQRLRQLEMTVAEVMVRLKALGKDGTRATSRGLSKFLRFLAFPPR